MHWNQVRERNIIKMTAISLKWKNALVVWMFMIFNFQHILPFIVYNFFQVLFLQVLYNWTNLDLRYIFHKCFMDFISGSRYATYINLRYADAILNVNKIPSKTEWCPLTYFSWRKTPKNIKKNRLDSMKHVFWLLQSFSKPKPIPKTKDC